MYTPKDVSLLAGVNERTLNYWSTSGLLSPTEPGAGRRPSRYSFRDLVAIRTVVRLREAGVGLQALRKAVAFICSTGDDALASVVLAISGDTVRAVSWEETFGAARAPGHAVLIICDVGDMAREMATVACQVA